MLGVDLTQADGMVAVIQGLPESALAVTLMDGSRQYTLMPNGNNQDVKKQAKNASTEISSDMKNYSCSSATQAVDGRYTSVYKTTHCKVQPTSPTVEVTEFPPQRAELSKGLGNFEVGGHGSGDTFTPTRTSSSFRGGLNWTERGGVCAPRQLYELDAFASSLRKYPSLSADRSTEIVERLISYSQTKNARLPRSQTSPSRSESISQGSDRRSCFTSARGPRAELDMNASRMPDESPTKDTTKRSDLESYEYRKSLYGRQYDVRCVQDMSKKIQDSIRSLSSYPYNYPVCPNMKAKPDQQPPEKNPPDTLVAKNSVHMETQAVIQMVSTEVSTLPREQPATRNATNSVNMETQAVAPMVSIEVSTLPREQPGTRNIAIPLSPCSSCFNCPQVQANLQCKTKYSSKSIQTPKFSDHSLKIRKSAHTCISSIDILQNNDKIKTGRKTKSQEELRKTDDIQDELLQLIKGLRSYTDLNVECGIRNALIRGINTIKESEPEVICNIDVLNSQTDVENKIGDEINDTNVKIKKRNKIIHGTKSTSCLSAENVSCCSYFIENRVDELIKEWLNNIPLLSDDHSEGKIENDQAMNSLTSKIKALVKDKVKTDSLFSLKPEIYGLIDDVSINTSAQNKNLFVNGLVNDLFKHIDNTFVVSSTYRKKWGEKTDLDKTIEFNIQPEVPGTYVQPTENELKHFVKQVLDEFANKFHLKICPRTREYIQEELTDLLIDSIEAIRYGKDKRVKEEILVMLYDFIDLSQHEAIYFVNNIIYNIKDMFIGSYPEKTVPQTFVVLQNTEHDFQTANFIDSNSKEAGTDQNIQKNLESYTKQIVYQINDWMLGVPSLNNIEPSFKQVVVSDLASDIIDRHKYLEINPNSRGTHADELEHLKYQIFKWINKVVGEDNLGAIEEASELMQRIQNVPAPVLTRLSMNVRKKQPPCCEKNNKRQQETGQRKPSVSHGKSFINCCAKYMASINETLTSNKNEHTETNINQMPKARSQSTHMSATEFPKELQENGRYSPLGDYPSHPSGATNQMPVAGWRGNTSVKCRSLNEQRNSINEKPTQSGKNLNEEYDEYLKNWVKQIPIDLEPAIVDTVRLGIYRGIWNAITKLCMEPGIQANPFYFQDLLDDEVEDLLCCLPKTSDFNNKKFDLKSDLLAKTSKWNQEVLKVNAPYSYKQSLIDSICHVLPKQRMDYLGQDTVKVGAEICKINLAEDFIMYSMYRENDQVKANVYKKKLIKHIQEFIDNLKRTQGKELKDILNDIPLFREELMNSLYKVPLPSEDTIRDEGDEILLGFEIEQWFSDLPLHPVMDVAEEVGRRRHKDNLASKIHEMKKHADLGSCEDQLRYEIMKFLKRIPLREDEMQNMKFMVDELVNRLKNKQYDVISGGEKMPVNFVDPNDYNEFSRDMQICSSFSETPQAKAQVDQSSYMIFDGTRVKNKDYIPYRDEIKQNIPESQIEWVSLLECSKVPPPAPYVRPSPGVQSGPQSPGNKSQFYNSQGFTSQPGEFRNDTMRSQPRLANSFTSNIRQNHQPQILKQPDAYVSSALPTQGTSPQRITPLEISGGFPGSNGIQASGGFAAPTGYPTSRNLDEPKYCNHRRGLDQAEEWSFRHNQSPHTSRPHPQSLPGMKIAGDFANGSSRADNCPHTSILTSANSNQQPTRPSFSLNGVRPVARRLSPSIYYGPENAPISEVNSSRAQAEQGPRYSSQDQASVLGQGAGQLSGREFYPSNGDISQTPMGYSTPQNVVPPPRMSRPKKRTRHIEKTKRDNARRRLDLDDSDESGRDEEVCRCMERIWRGRPGRNKPAYCPCEEFEMNMPPCFPMRYPYPYYFQNW